MGRVREALGKARDHPRREQEKGTMNPRPYQVRAIAEIEREWQQVNRTLLVLPTGTGKTIVFSLLARDIVAQGGRVLIIAHRDELIRQAAAKLQASTGLQAAVEKAEESAEDCMERVIVASVQTLLSEKRRESIWRPTNIIVDEAHHAVSPSYLSVLEHWPEAKVLGVTATADRSDKKALGTFFESMAYEYHLPQAISEGYLAPIRALTLPTVVNLAAAGPPANGDWSAQQCATALDPYIPTLCAQFAEHAKDRKGLVFVPLRATGKKIRAALEQAGLRAYYCDGEDRSQIALWEQDSDGSVMVNAMLLTEGYDHPPISALAVWRFTKSRAFYAQMVGRGTRLSPETGKQNLLLLDNLFLCDTHQLCRPAHIMTDDDDVAEAMTDAAEKSATEGCDLDEAAVAEAQAQVVKDREASLAAKLAEMRHKRQQLVDPLQYASSIGSATISYEPTMPAERAPATAAQVDALSKSGIYPGDVTTAGHAAAILADLARRKAAGMAQPRQIRKLEQYGWKHAGQLTMVAASKIIGRIAANGWRLPEGMKPQ
jgi:superfamily II DNA or RNA helicase